MRPLTDPERTEIEELCELLPGVVRTALNLLGEPEWVRDTSSDVPREYQNELAIDLTSIGEELVSDQYQETPDITPGFILRFLPYRLQEWHLDNQTIKGTKAATNRQRRCRYHKWLKENPSERDPMENEKDIRRGLKPEYTRAEETDLFLFPDSDQLPQPGYTLHESEVPACEVFYQLLYIFVADDDVDRSILKYLWSQFDREDEDAFLELEKVPQRKIAKAVGVSQGTVSNRITRMRETLRNINVRGVPTPKTRGGSVRPR